MPRAVEGIERAGAIAEGRAELVTVEHRERKTERGGGEQMTTARAPATWGNALTSSAPSPASPEPWSPWSRCSSG